MEPEIVWQNPLVRNLAWVLSSPPLLARHDPDVHWLEPAWFTGITDAYRERLAELDRDPAPLTAALAGLTDHRLGSHFEALWRFWLNDNPRYRLLHANLAIREPQRTIGEFDFLVQDRETGKVLHWEVAVKFYLGSGDTLQLHNWWGPARRDRLDIKTARILEHQSQLSKHPAARQLLQELKLEVDETWLMVKGRLFYPSGSENQAPVDACATHLRGFWMTRSALASRSTARWLELGPDQRLAPLAQNSAVAGVTGAALADEWEHRFPQYPVCLARVEAGVEIERGFIVPDDWEQSDPHGC